MKVIVYHDNFGKIMYENVRRFYTEGKEYHIVKSNCRITLERQKTHNFRVIQQEIAEETDIPIEQ
jgi:hypothetical protein